MTPDTFAGDRKSGRWLCADLERAFVARAVPRVPRFLETHHLTLLTIPWCAAVIACGALAVHDLRWLWGASAAIALQYLTDLLDGAVGRHRETGLVRWGYHMDHFLDYAFLCAIWIGYAFLLPPAMLPWLLVLLGLGGAFMVNAFLSFAATNEFEISCFGIGPTEIRAGFIAFNTAVIAFGPGLLIVAIPLLAAAQAVALTAVVHRTQRRLWYDDLARRDAA